MLAQGCTSGRQATASASLGKNITQGLSAYMELFFASSAEHGDRNSLGFDTGAVYLLTRHITLDGAVSVLFGR